MVHSGWPAGILEKVENPKEAHEPQSCPDPGELCSNFEASITSSTSLNQDSLKL